MPAPRASAFLKLRHLAIWATFFGVTALTAPMVAPAAAGGLVTSNLLEGYERPLTVVVDLMDDSSDSQTIALNVKQALANQGIPAVEDGEVVLEVNVSASAEAAGTGRSVRAEAESRDAAKQNDQLTTLAPTRELSPNTPDSKSRRAGNGGANLDISMTLYKRGHPPIWRASGSVSRDFRSLADQGSELAVKSLTLFGKTGTVTID